VNDSDQHRPRSLKTWGVILGTVVVAGLAVASFGTFAGAADDNSSTSSTAPDGTARPHPQLTEDQKQCLVDHGVTLGQKPADGTPWTPPTDAERAARQAAAEACGLPVRGPGGPGGGFGPGGPHGDRPALTDEQKKCLADNGVTFGQRPADGSRPTPPTDAERAALRAAAATCGLISPAHPQAQGTSA
jgi:hypothetical protein